MLDYLFDEDYQDAKQDYINAREKRNKLERIKNDLLNDSGPINGLNSRVEDIYEDFIRCIEHGGVRAAVAGLIGETREPHQTADGDLMAACDCIEAERSLLQNKMWRAESTMDSIKNRPEED